MMIIRNAAWFALIIAAVIGGSALVGYGIGKGLATWDPEGAAQAQANVQYRTEHGGLPAWAAR